MLRLQPGSFYSVTRKSDELDDGAGKPLQTDARARTSGTVRLEKAFARGSGHGLLQLGAGEVEAILPPVFAYWRELGARYVTALCAVPFNGSPVESEDPSGCYGRKFTLSRLPHRVAR